MFSFWVELERYKRLYGPLYRAVPELIAVRFGLRTATQVPIVGHENFERQYPLIEAFGRENGLVVSYYKYNRPDEYHVIISSRELEPVADGEDENKDNRYGYPECCIENYEHKCYWLFNHMHELVEPLSDRERLDFRMNPFLLRTPFHLYRHFPCSLECRDTLKYASRLLDIIRVQNPDLYDRLVLFNRAPVFYTDIAGRGILFVGELDDEGVVRYSDFYFDKDIPLETLKRNAHEDISLLKRVVGALRFGNGLRVTSESMEILEHQKVLDRIENPGHLVWKVIDFV